MTNEFISKNLDPKKRQVVDLWNIYKFTKKRNWLRLMFYYELFENTPMPKEINREIFKVLSESIYEGSKKRKNHDRDEDICLFYGVLDDKHDGTFKQAAIRAIAKHQPDLTFESVRTILRRKFDRKKHTRIGRSTF